jgi:benzoate membrane transport protein
MFRALERPRPAWPNARSLLADFGPGYAAHGFIGLLFAATAPVAIILSIGTRGGLTEAELSSWIFGVFVVNGLISIVMSARYRSPLAFFWTIPGTVLVGPALTHLPLSAVIGAFYATGLLILMLGATGWVRPVMRAIPMPIVMGMVCGVFLRFGLELVRALHADLGIAGPMVAVWLTLTALPGWGRRLPPLIGALIVGIGAVALSRSAPILPGTLELARPMLQMPTWSWPAMVELVIPLTMTVVLVQNGQGIAILGHAGHEPPVNAATFACGIGSLLSATVGGVSSCLAGPANAIITSSGSLSRRYTSAMFAGALSIVFGAFSPAFTRFMLHAPAAFVASLAGLAMLRVLQSAFMTAFKERFTLGALIALLVTVTDQGLWNIGAAFWGLVAGCIVSWCLERRDFSNTLD